MNRYDEIDPQLLDIVPEQPLPRSKLAKFGSFIKHSLSVMESIAEGGSIGYTDYIILTYAPQLEGHWGYGFVIFGSLMGGVTEILHISELMSNKQHAQYNKVKEAIAGGSVAAVFAQQFMPETIHAVGAGGAIAVVLSSSKALLEIFNNRPFFETKAGKIIEYTAGGIYNALMAAGITDYLFSICEGFGAEIHPAVKYGVTGGLCLANLLADLPINKTHHDGERGLCYNPAKLFRSGLYGSEISLFLMILLFDMYTNINSSTEISNPVFYSVLSASLFEGLLVSINKFVNEGAAEREEAARELQVNAFLNEHDDSCMNVIKRGWASFWAKPEIEEYVRPREFLDPEPELKWWQRPSRLLSDCFKRFRGPEDPHKFYDEILDEHDKDRRYS